MSPHSFKRALLSSQLHCSLITAHFPKAFLCSPSLDYSNTTKTRKSQANDSRRKTQHELYFPSIYRSLSFILTHIQRISGACYCSCKLIYSCSVAGIPASAFFSLKSLLSRPLACKENPVSFTSKKQMAINLFLNTVGIQLFPRNLHLLKSK